MMTLCPICAAVCREHRLQSPYWKCGNCDVLFQDPMGSKVYHGSHEAPPEQMSDADKAANEYLAGWLFDTVMKGKPGPTLDIGAAYPYLASRLQTRDCESIAIDGEATPNDLGFALVRCDLERDDMELRDGNALITCIHSYEHFYRPLDAFRKLRRLIADDGRLFIRSPDHRVAGIERDMTPGHFSIHPFVHTLSSILQICVETGDTFEVESYEQMQPGQMNVILKPL